jgi:hypothetical protein
VLGQGDFVLTVSEGLYGPVPGVPTAFTNVPHQPGRRHDHRALGRHRGHPAPEQQANNNGMSSGFPDYVQPALFA